MDFENTVYVIDPDQDMSRSLAGLLGTYDIPVKSFVDAESFLEAVRSESTKNSCLLLELDLPGAAGMPLLRKLRDEHQSLPIIATCHSVSQETGQQARDAGANDFIEKSLVGAYLFHRLADLIPGANKLPHTEPSIMEITDGKQVTFRMTHPEDAELQQAFVVALSLRSRYMRFFSGLNKLPTHVLKQFTTPLFPISYAVVAVICEGEQERQIGVARWAPTGTTGIAEFAVVVADDCQGQGIASRLMRLLITAATVGGLQRLEGLILKENAPMLAMVQKMGFTICPDHDAGPSIVMYVKELRDSAD
jgi:DNA-binding response OmpR family regulator/GNAT superfamily N-acetyltransferase